VIPSLKRLALEGTIRLVEGLDWLLPKRKHAVVAGFPDTEGNAVELVRALAPRYRGRIYWLVDGDRVSDPRLSNVETLPKRSPRAIVKYATAEIVFFTHGLFGDVRPPRRQTIVNLWHGDGFKAKGDAHTRRWSMFPATYTSGTSALLVERRREHFRMPEGSAIVSGNPRLAQLSHAPAREFWSFLSDRTGCEQFILWMPTFRGSQGTLRVAGSEDSAEAPDFAQYVPRLVDELRMRGYGLLLKPHPADRESFETLGLPMIGEENLQSWGVSLYGLLGASSGLITDYSSVWVEYLLLERPIGFLMPDRDAYLRSRGVFPPDLYEWLPGPDLLDEAGMGEFVESRQQNTLPRRHSAAAVKLGLARPSESPADDLLDVLEKRRAFGRTKRLRDRGPKVEGELLFRGSAKSL